MPAEQNALHAIPRRAIRNIDHNISKKERVTSIFAGTILTLSMLRIFGSRKKRMSGILPVLLGTELIRRGVTGVCYFYRLVSNLGFKDKMTELGDKVKKVRNDLRTTLEKDIVSERTITIQKPRETLYRYYRDLEKSPSYMKNIREVQVLDEKRSHWVANLVDEGGLILEWDSEIIEERELESLTWKVIHPPEIKMQGQMIFSDFPKENGTEIKSILTYALPGGELTRIFASMFGMDPDQQNKENLRHFKQLMETGEIPVAKLA